MNYLQVPLIHHEFTNDRIPSVDQINDSSTVDNEGYNGANPFRNRFDEMNQKYMNRRSPYSSTENSPVHDRKNLVNCKVGFRERTNSITPRLSMPNIEKFDVDISCPDGQTFKAGVFKAWTAFQLAWKIAHVKGMSEKLALLVQEIITELHLIRQIEDHEVVYTVMQKWAPDSNNSLRLEEDVTKYDLFNEPADYLPIEMFATDSKIQASTRSRSRRSSLLKSIMVADQTLDLQGWVFMKDFNLKNWKRTYLRLKDSMLYTCENEEDDEGTLIYSCKSSFMYNCLPSFNDAHGTPFPHSFCIIPDVVTDWSEIKCFSLSSKRFFIGWTAGIRLAKYGQQLYMNFREAMNKEANLRRTNSARQSILVRRSFGDHVDTKDNKATLDFSGNNGRVISDPIEAIKAQNEIAFEIPKTMKRRSASFAPAVVRQTLLTDKPWYHGKLDRDQAVHRLKKHGMREGLYLIRDSTSSHGNLVLTVTGKKGRITHHQVFQSCAHSGVPLYGVEHGPQFSSLELLIESYHSGAVEGAAFMLRKACPIS